MTLDKIFGFVHTQRVANCYKNYCQEWCVNYFTSNGRETRTFKEVGNAIQFMRSMCNVICGSSHFTTFGGFNLDENDNEINFIG